MNYKENRKQVIKQIVDHPETWDQRYWHCGSTHCMAGLAQIIAGKPENTITVVDDAIEFLGITDCEAIYYFNIKRTLPELKTIIYPRWVRYILITIHNITSKLKPWD